MPKPFSETKKILKNAGVVFVRLHPEESGELDQLAIDCEQIGCAVIREGESLGVFPAHQVIQYKAVANDIRRITDPN